MMAGSRVALLVNNLGSISDLEMNIVAYEAIKLLGNRNTFSLRFCVLLFCWKKNCVVLNRLGLMAHFSVYDVV